MRVALDMTAAPPRLSGAGHYMAQLAIALPAAGVDLEVVARTVHAAALRDHGGCRVHPAAPDARPLRLVWEQVGLPRLVRRLGVDLLHSPHYTMPLATRLPVVVTVHDATFFTHAEFHERVKVAFFRTAMRLAARRARRIITDSEAARVDVLSHTDADPDRVHTVHLGVDLDAFQTPSEQDVDAFRARHSLAGPYVAYLGVLEPRKNLPRLVRAFSRLAGDWPGVLALAGPPGWAGEELEQALAAAPSGRVRRLGYLDDHERRPFLGGAAAVCYPSLAEGFGLPVLEAMATGAPVVTAGVSATAEVAGTAAELVDPLDVHAIEAGLRRVLLDDARAAELRAAGPPRAALFPWSKTAAETAAVYRAALG